MGAGTSTALKSSYDNGTQHDCDHKQQQPRLLKVMLDTSTTPATPEAFVARASRIVPGAGAAIDSDEPPALINAADDSPLDVPSEVVRKSLMLPTTSAQHVGRLVVKSSIDSADQQQIVWEVPKSAFLPASPSSPKQAAPAASGTDAPTPLLLLSPTFILPCGVNAGGGRVSAGTTADSRHAADTPELACTEWQLVLEPHLVPAAQPDITNGPDTPPKGSSPMPSSPGATSAMGALAGAPSDMVQVWKPSLRFLWSPGCTAATQNGKQHDSPAGSSTASISSGFGHPSTGSVSCGSSVGGGSSVDDGSSQGDPTAMQALPVGFVGSESSSSSSQCSRGERETGRCDSVIKQVERKLLPSSWSIRKKNLAPASYKAAYQAQLGKDAAAAAIAATAREPHAGSTAFVEAAQAASYSVGQQNSSSVRSQPGDHVGSSGSRHSSSTTSGGSTGWRLQCRGRLCVEGAGAGGSVEAASSGFAFQLNQFGSLWGAPFSIQCSSCTTDSNSSLQLSLLPAVAGTTAGACSLSQPPTSSNTDALSISVDFSEVQLLFNGATNPLPPTAAAACKALAASDSAQTSHTHSSSSSSSSSTAHQQHPLGQSPPHTPTKDNSSTRAGQQGASQSSSTSGLDSASQTDREAGVVARPVAARQLEAVLLSHSPRMLVIDGFFTPELCNNLMELARDKLVRSRVASGSETPSRTSWGHFFVKENARHPLILEAEAQIEALFNSAAARGGYGPLAKVEALQVVHHHKGEFYQEHYDDRADGPLLTDCALQPPSPFLCPPPPLSTSNLLPLRDTCEVVRYHKGEFYHEHYDNRADGPLTRAATILVYLCDTEEGGATSFSRAQHGFGSCPATDAQVLPPKVTVGQGGRGIKIFPVQGRALVFWSKRPNGDEDPNSIHAADTVVAGEKWIATRWMKDNL